MQILRRTGGAQKQSFKIFLDFQVVQKDIEVNVRCFLPSRNVQPLIRRDETFIWNIPFTQWWMSKRDSDKIGRSGLRSIFPDKETTYFSLLYLLHISCIVGKIIGLLHILLGFPSGSAGKESACNAGELGSIPEEGNGYPLQYSGLENSMDCIVHGVAKSQTRLNDFHFHIYYY